MYWRSISALVRWRSRPSIIEATSESVSASSPSIAAVPSATRLIPMFVPSPKVHSSSSRRRSTFASVTVREATEVKWFVTAQLPIGMSDS
ncbi:hypothetical protein AB0395_45830 [Streptosporangium sp. NPDC051023]|uniref:hypothetical protein n=1 Tax=Streptosporangium sp. NPDC051023 TaxID=3155410 RepID=UPI00344C698B